jgi:hypothetical protein
MSLPDAIALSQRIAKEHGRRWKPEKWLLDAPAPSEGPAEDPIEDDDED